MSATLVQSGGKLSTDGSSVTTDAVDTTGADCIVLYCTDFFYNATPSDSKSNTWTGGTIREINSIKVKPWYCLNPTVGSGHTFTFAPGASGNPGISFQAWSGIGEVLTLDQDVGTSTSTSDTSQATGTLTPTEGDEVLITGFVRNGAGGITVTHPTGFTSTSNLESTANSQGAYMAYKIQTTATAEGATWTLSAGDSNQSASMISLRSATADIEGTIADDLVSFWPLDEASGNALDAHGSNELTETSGTIGTGTGLVYATARDFEAGDTEYFAIASNADLQTGDIDFTFAAWINLEAGSTGNMDFISKWSGSADEYLVGLDSSERPRFLVKKGDDSSFTLLTATTYGVVPTATWVFVVAWHNAATDRIGISINGGSYQTANHTGGVRTDTAPFWIGARENVHFDGLLGPVLFFKRHLHADEIAWLYSAGAGRTYEELVPPPGGGLSIPIAAYHYRHHLESMAG